MKLKEQYFNCIKDGSKKYEIRLNDEKRQLIKVGDFIEFQKEPELEEKALSGKLPWVEHSSDGLNARSSGIPSSFSLQRVFRISSSEHLKMG